MPSPPKPWERAGATVASPAPPTPALAPAPATTTTPSSTAPSVPARPAALTTPATTTFPGTSTALNSAYASPYGSSYSPYNRFGTSSYSPYGMNSMYGGGYGGYSSYGGYGMGGMGGMGGMYGGVPGMGYGMPGGPFDPNNPSLTQSLEASTQHTFALLQSIVQTFSGVAQMLESTFMATHSSFFAMVGVVDQFGQLRNALGSVLGLFGLIRWMRDLLTGRRAQGPAGAMRGEFRDFINGRPVQGPAGPPPPKASRKPLIIFLLAVFGVPYAMHKLIRVISARQEAQMQAAGQIAGAPLPPLDPSQLTFARALYPFDASSPSELALKENEIVAIMGKLDPATGAEVDPRVEVEGSDWWKGRTRDGREGWFPKKWVQVLERRRPAEGAEPKKIES